jgi:LysR family transcriptional regulator, glycine cleavage system transcriptional activator
MRMPALNGFRAFDAAARHLSMKLAAEELSVTPSAISQQLRGLEEDLGVALFRRNNRSIALTKAGQDLLPAVRGAFRLISDASERIRGAADSRLLTVSVTPFFAETWLVPRLAHFNERHPDIDLRITATTALANLAAGEADVAIRHGLGRYRDLDSDLIITPTMTPVAAPELVARLGGPSGAADLMAWPKVHDVARGGWEAWFASQGLAYGPARGPSFDDSGLLRTAVLTGQGAGLLPSPLIEPDIRAGRLVALADSRLIEGLAYYLVIPVLATSRPAVAAFRDWVLAQRQHGNRI